MRRSGSTTRSARRPNAARAWPTISGCCPLATRQGLSSPAASSGPRPGQLDRFGAGDWSGHDVYLSGPPAMVRVSVDSLRRHGVPLDRMHHDPITDGR